MLMMRLPKNIWPWKQKDNHKKIVPVDGNIAHNVDADDKFSIVDNLDLTELYESNSASISDTYFETGSVMSDITQDKEASDEEENSNTTDIIIKLQSGEPSIDSLYDSMPMSDDLYSLLALKSSIMLSNRVLSEWSSMKSSSEEDQKAYEQGKKVFLAHQKIVEEMLAVPLPDNSEASRLTYVNEIKRHVQRFFAQKTPPIEGRKSLLWTKFYREFLENFNVLHLFDAHDKEIKGLEDIKEKTQILLSLQEEKIKQSVYEGKDRLTTRDAIWSVLIHERRLAAEHRYKLSGEIKIKPSSEALQQALKKLKEASADFLKAIIDYPESYRATSNQEEIKALFKDLLCSLHPEEYLLIENSPKASKELYSSFVFSSPEVSAFLFERGPGNINKESLSNQLEKQKPRFEAMSQPSKSSTNFFKHLLSSTPQRKVVPANYVNTKYSL